VQPRDPDVVRDDDVETHRLDDRTGLLGERHVARPRRHDGDDPVAVARGDRPPDPVEATVREPVDRRARRPRAIEGPPLDGRRPGDQGAVALRHERLDDGQQVGHGLPLGEHDLGDADALGAVPVDAREVPDVQFAGPRAPAPSGGRHGLADALGQITPGVEGPEEERWTAARAWSAVNPAPNPSRIIPRSTSTKA
jgi:hypothetical protein